MSKFVVDANVAIKWVLPEIHSEIAQRLLDDVYELLVPDFFFSDTSVRIRLINYNFNAQNLINKNDYLLL